MYSAKVKHILAPARAKAVSMAVGMFAVTFVAAGLAIVSAGNAVARGAPDSFAENAVLGILAQASLVTGAFLLAADLRSVRHRVVHELRRRGPAVWEKHPDVIWAPVVAPTRGGAQLGVTLAW